MKKYKYSKSVTIDGKRYLIRADTQIELGVKINKKMEEIKNSPRKLSAIPISLKLQRLRLGCYIGCYIYFISNDTTANLFKFTNKLFYFFNDAIFSLTASSIN